MIEKISYSDHIKLSEFGLQTFFDKTFKCFEKEINSLANTIFKEKKSHNVFALIERAWIGVLNNAIIRAFPDNAVTLQEFAVYTFDNNVRKYTGRSDLLVRWVDQNKNEFYLLFEAKCHEEKDGSNLNRDSENLSVLNQVSKYYKTELEYYNGKNVFLISIAFGWIRKKNVLEMAIKSAKMGSSSIDFCHLYHNREEGMWVYGGIFKPC